MCVVYVHVCVCVCASAHMCVHVYFLDECACGGQRSVEDGFLPFSTLFFKAGSFPEPRAQIQLGQPASEPQGAFCLLLLSAGLHATTPDVAYPNFNDCHWPELMFHRAFSWSLLGSCFQLHAISNTTIKTSQAQSPDCLRAHVARRTAVSRGRCP